MSRWCADVALGPWQWQMLHRHEPPLLSDLSGRQGHGFESHHRELDQAWASWRLGPVGRPVRNAQSLTMRSKRPSSNRS